MTKKKRTFRMQLLHNKHLKLAIAPIVFQDLKGCQQFCNNHNQQQIY